MGFKAFKHVSMVKNPFGSWFSCCWIWGRFPKVEEWRYGFEKVGALGQSLKEIKKVMGFEVFLQKKVILKLCKSDFGLEKSNLG